MPRKPTYEELGKRVKELERQLGEIKEVEFSLHDSTAFQSVLAVLRGVSSEDTEERFLQTFLSEVVKKYGFCMSWYGRYEDGTIRPILSAGNVDHYLDNLVLDVRESTSPDAVCAMSQAILNKIPFSYGDLERDEGFRRWRDYALELGYRSNLAMPLKVDGHIEGGVMVYADTPHAFPEVRTVRLMQLTAELGALLSERRARLRADRALQESEENFRALAENANDGIMIVVGEGIHVYANKKAAEITGYTVSKLLGSTIKDLAPPQEFEAVQKRYRKIIEGQDFPVQYEIVFFRKNGKAVPLEVTSSRTTWRGEPADLVIFRDITDRKKAVRALKKSQAELVRQVEVGTQALSELNEELKKKTAEHEQMQWALDESEARFRSLVEQIPNAIIYTASVDETTTTLYMSPQIEQILGYTREEFTADPDLRTKSIHPDDYDSVKAELARCHNADEQFVSEYRMIRKDGRTIWFHDNARMVKDKHGTPLFLLGVSIDITEQRRAREKLQASEEKFSTAFRCSTAAIIISTVHEGRFIDVNESFLELTGYTREEVIGHTTIEMGLWQDIDQRKECVQEIQEHGRVRGYEIKYRRKSGEIGTGLLSAETVVVENEERLLFTIVDISENKQAYEDLVKRESELAAKKQELEELNAALKVLLKRREEDKADLQERIVVNVKDLVLPYIEKLKDDHLSPQQTTVVSIIESNIKEIISPFATRLSSKFLNLTPTELRVASMVKDGRSSNEIAELMNLSPNTIMFHRYNLRRKLDLKQKKVNLRSYLRSLQD